MLTYAEMVKKPEQFREITGIDVPEFDSLFRKIEEQYKATEAKRLSRSGRERRIGAGRPFKLSIRERLLMLLVYYRCRASYALLERVFDIDASTVCRDIKKIEPAVNMHIKIPKRSARRTAGTTAIESLLAYRPELAAASSSA